MKTTINWIKRHLDFNESGEWLDQLEQNIPIFGLELDNKTFINPILSVRVLEVKKIGNTLSKCQIKLGKIGKQLYNKDIITVLCGANNLRDNMVSVLAPLGTKIKGFTIEKRKMMNVESEGMLLSREEIGLPPVSEGIITMEELGEELFSYEDIILDFSVPTNRWDLHNTRGIARELELVGLGTLKNLPVENGTYNSEIDIDNQTDVTMSFAEINNIKVRQEVLSLMDLCFGKSKELQHLNDFVLMDIGHPIHIYDKKYCNKGLKIHYENSPKLIKTLKGDFTTTNANILISNNEEILCIGGIVGIKGYEENSKNVIIEAGYFRNEHISQVFTNSAKNFYLEIDHNQPTINYILTLLEGDKSAVIWSGKPQPVREPIFLSTHLFFEVCGISYSMEEIIELLKGYSCELKQRSREDTVNDEFGFLCTPPSWRLDLKTPKLLIQEILRLNKFKLLNTNFSKINYSNLRCSYDFFKNILISKNFTEVYNFPFVEKESEIKIINSIQSHKPYLRNSLEESLLEQAKIKLSYGDWGVQIFEFGKIYPSEKEVLGILIAGKKHRNWYTSGNFELLDLQKIQGLLGYDLDFESEIKILNPSCFYLEIKLNSLKIRKSLEEKNLIYIDFSFKFKEKIEWSKIENKILEIKEINSLILFDIFEDKYGFTITISPENRELVEQQLKLKILNLGGQKS